MNLTKRQQQKEETKKRIVEVAYKIYAEKGFQATTSDIAKEANVSHGTIFVHFSTLNELLIYILEDFGYKVGMRLHELAEGSESISDVLEAHLNALEEHEFFYTRLISESHLLPSEIRNTFVSIQSIIAFHMNKVIEEEIARGYIKNMPTHIIFNTWVGLVHYYLQNGDIFAPDASVIKRYSSELTTHFLELIKK